MLKSRKYLCYTYKFITFANVKQNNQIMNKRKYITKVENGRVLKPYFDGWGEFRGYLDITDKK